MLSGAGFGDEFFLAHVFCQQSLAHAVVELVGAGMIEIFAFKIDSGAAKAVRQTLGKVNRGGAPLKMLADRAQFRNEAV